MNEELGQAEGIVEAAAGVEVARQMLPRQGTHGQPTILGGGKAAFEEALLEAYDVFLMWPGI